MELHGIFDCPLFRLKELRHDGANMSETTSGSYVPTQTFEQWFPVKNPGISVHSAASVLRLVAEGGTVPFIARYRKEQTGNLDEVGIQAVIDAKENWDQILKRQEFILGEIDRQQKLTPELKAKIQDAFQLEILEDLYLPYKQKRKTKATVAREAGLEPLANWIWDCGHGTEKPQEGQTLEIWAFTFRNDEKNIKDAQAAIDGAQDILIERLAETQSLRSAVRSALFDRGYVRTSKGEKAKPNSKFENYFNYHEMVSKLLEPQNSHRYLAIRRGWMEEELALTLGGKPEGEDLEAELLKTFEAEACTVWDSPGAAILKKAARLALKAHVWSSIESEVHKSLKQIGDDAAIKVFSENVRKLLLAAPFGSKAVLGVDPGIRTGCKLAVVDSSGKYLASNVMHLQTEDARRNAQKLLVEVAKNVELQAIAVGNGTAGRETEVFIRKALKDEGLSVPVVMVNEAGASVYSASEAAREEFPELDLTVRGAISIARRLQDPLAELVKIDPKSIGVGQYQHDVSQPALKRSLDLVVDSCVNQVGVNLNTASYHLLSHVAGIGPSLAKAIVEFRGSKGLFKSRDALLEVPRFSKKAFEQAAGFLRIPESENPLDNTGVHPERYAVLTDMASNLGKSTKDLIGSGVDALRKLPAFKQAVGEFTADDICKELAKPGRDPREKFSAFSFREDISEVKDLKSGMICPGIVTNVTNFGAFVDIGVHQDGLVHISQLSTSFVKDPREAVSPGDHVTVKVLEVNLEKNQIALSIRAAKEGNAGAVQAPRPSAQRDSHSRPMPSASGSKLPSARDSHHSHQGHSGRGGGGGSSKPAPAFNNPFAGLASLKRDLPPKSR
jgi:uncharacterized protein